MKYILWFSWWIDSTFAAWYLKEQWHNVLLINLKTTAEPNKCCQLPKDLIKIAEKLNLPLKIIDVTKEFKSYVIDYFAENYKLGLTPNPCINCNQLVRFPILNKIREELWYDKIATWHYSKVINIENKYFLAKAKDQKKDQTYMLYSIIWLKTSSWENLLKYIDFPLWNFTKDEIKEIFINKLNLYKDYKESQNICFIPNDDYPRYIKQNYNVITKTWPIYDVNWNYLWEHKWLIYYTIWQRKNIFLHKEKIAMNKKRYVVKIDYKNNSLILWEEKDLYKKEVIIWNAILMEDINLYNKSLYWKIRYHHAGEKIEKLENLWNNKFKIIFKNPVRAPTPWQHLVIYSWHNKENDLVLWWGIIL